MESITLRNNIQEKAIDSWVKRGGNSSLIMSQGIGKSFIMYKTFYKALELKWINKGDTIYIFSFTNDQSDNLKKEGYKFLELYNKNPFEDFDLKFWCYQSIPKGSRAFDVYDEHLSLPF